MLLDVFSAELVQFYLRRKTVSLLDDFGLYRNVYHSLAGLYMQPWCLSESRRFVLHNMFVISVMPFGSNEQDLAKCLEDESIRLEFGKIVTLATGETVKLFMFPMALTGDMLQQNENAGVKTHKSAHGCRLCHIHSNETGDLNHDVIFDGRYSQETEFKFEMALGERTAADRTNGLASLGLKTEGHIFGNAFPCMNPFTGYPCDPMHAELRLAKYFQAMLTESIFSAAGIAAYEQAWNAINVPYGWGQPQNPASHQKSMVFAESGRMAQMLPLVFLIMFSDANGVDATKRKSFWKGAVGKEGGYKEKMHMVFAPRSNLTTFEPGNILLEVSYAVAEAIHLVMRSTLTNKEFLAAPALMLRERRLLKQMFLTTPKSETYAACQNLHLGVHWRQDTRNYGTFRNVGVMIGEQTHKLHKVHAAHTNSNDTELQLLKAVNTAHTLRFILNGVFNETNAAARQTTKVLEQCPTVKKKFLSENNLLGGPELEPRAAADVTLSYAECTNTIFSSANLSSRMQQRLTQPATRAADLEIILPVFSAENGDVMFTDWMKRRLEQRYYARLVCELKVNGRTRKISVRVGSPVKLRTRKTTGSGYGIVERIVRISLTGTNQAFIIARPLTRNLDGESKFAPYEVYDDILKTLEAYPLSALEHVNVHMVPRPGGVDSWWLNTFVTHCRLRLCQFADPGDVVPEQLRPGLLQPGRLGCLGHVDR